MFICFHIVCGWFCLTTAELDSFKGDHVVKSLKNLLSGISQKKKEFNCHWAKTTGAEIQEGIRGLVWLKRQDVESNCPGSAGLNWTNYLM